MRVISGKWGGTRLVAPKGHGTRPTGDRTREALFSMLAARLEFDGLRVLDLFAGSGALGLEALSRGAAACTLVDNNHAACAAIKTNIAACRAEADAVLLRCDACCVPGRAQFDLVFLDPPYGKGLGARALAVLGTRVTRDAVIVVEEAARSHFVAPDGFVETGRRKKGDSELIFLAIS